MLTHAVALLACTHTHTHTHTHTNTHTHTRTHTHTLTHTQTHTQEHTLTHASAWYMHSTPAAHNSALLPHPSRARRIQQRVQELRVTLIRAAGRLGLRYDSEQVCLHECMCVHVCVQQCHQQRKRWAKHKLSTVSELSCADMEGSSFVSGTDDFPCICMCVVYTNLPGQSGTWHHPATPPMACPGTPPRV